jgi:hypothetical protein
MRRFASKALGLGWWTVIEVRAAGQLERRSEDDAEGDLGCLERRLWPGIGVSLWREM